MPNTVNVPEPGPSETIVELGRMSNLSDGVFAIALTLLVLDIRIPDDALTGELSVKLVELAPKLLIYLISFIVIGGAWGSHQRMLSQIKRGDGLLVWFNLLSLLFVTLVPASAGLLGRFPGEFFAIALFAANVILIQLTALWLWRHASKHGLVNAALDPRVVTGIGRRLILIAAAFGLSVVLALFNASVVYVVWIGLFLFVFTTDWLSWQLALKPTQAAIPLDGAARGQIDVFHGGGLLTMVANAPENALAEGTFVGGVDSQVSRDGDLVKTQLRVGERRGFTSVGYFWAWGAKITPDWTLSLNPRVPLALNMVLGANQVDLDFTEAHLTELKLQAGASEIKLRLPTNAGQTTIYVEAGTTSLEIYVPAAVAARIQATQALASIEVDLNRFLLAEDGKGYRSKDYDTAANRVDIQLELGLGSAKIV